MPRLRFRLPDRETIRQSPNGLQMLETIENDFPEKNILITGCPGSGKTTVSIHRLIHQVLRPNPRRVQMLTFMRLLNVAIADTLEHEGVANPMVDTLCNWYKQKTHGGWFYEKDKPDQPDADEIRERLAGALANAPLDELILDEGQDVHLKGFRSLPHLARKFTVSGDGAQSVCEKGIQDVDFIEDALQNDIGGGIHKCPLEYIYRTSYIAYEFHRRFALDVPSANEPAVLKLLRDFRLGDEDDRPKIHVYNSGSVFRQHLAEIINEAVIDEKQSIVAILVPGKEDVNTMANVVQNIQHNGQPRKCTRYYHGLPALAEVENVLITTFMSAKGMEFDTVIIPKLPDHTVMNWPDVGTQNSTQARYSKNLRRQCLVACTRARSRLHIFCPNSLHPMLRPENFPPDTYDLRHLAPPPQQNTQQNNPLPF
jgi:DNA helicase IV